MFESKYTLNNLGRLQTKYGHFNAPIVQVLIYGVELWGEGISQSIWNNAEEDIANLIEFWSNCIHFLFNDAFGIGMLLLKLRLS